MQGNPMMRTRMPALTIIALLGFCIQANAQAPCPELTRLRSEAQEALKQSMTVPRRSAAICTFVCRWHGPQ